MDEGRGSFPREITREWATRWAGARDGIEEGTSGGCYRDEQSGMVELSVWEFVCGVESVAY